MARERVAKFGALTGLVMALVLSLAVFAGAWSNYSRNGRFPNRGEDLARLCCTPATTLAGLAPGEQTASVPIAAFPLVEAGLRAAAAKDADRARALMNAAARRDPQLATARFWLVQDALAHNRLKQAIGHLDWLYAIDPGPRGQFIDALAGIATLPGGMVAMRSYVQRNPEWRKAVVDKLVINGATPATIYALVNSSKDATSGGGAALIIGMLAKKDYQRAYLAWLAQLPAANLGDVGYIYDGAFHGLPGPAPFNWSLNDSDGVTTNLNKGGGAHISYYGDGALRMMEQMMVLPPGGYVLEVTTRSLSPADANQISAMVSCVAPGSSPLATIRLPSSGKMARLSARFVVPVGCAAQSVAFIGAPAEFPKPAEFDVTSVVVKNTPS